MNGLWHMHDVSLDKDHFPCTEHSEPKTPWPTARKSWYPKIGAIGTAMARWCFVKSPQKSQRHNLLAFWALEIFHVWCCKYTLWWNRGVTIKNSKKLVDYCLPQYHNKLPFDFKLSEKVTFESISCLSFLNSISTPIRPKPTPEQWELVVTSFPKRQIPGLEDFGFLASKMSC